MVEYRSLPSPAFDKAAIDWLNVWIEDHLSPTVYLAAYYMPKEGKNTSITGKLLYDVTNLYGLYKDCAPFWVDNREHWGKGLLSVLTDNGFLSYQEAKSLRMFFKNICNLRSLLCHNNCGDNFYHFENWFHSKIFLTPFLKEHCVLPSVFNPVDQMLEVINAKNLVNQIECDASHYLDCFRRALESIAASDSVGPVVEAWVKILAHWYAVNGEAKSSVYMSTSKYLVKNGWQVGKDTIEEVCNDKVTPIACEALIKYAKSQEDALPYAVITQIVDSALPEITAKGTLLKNSVLSAGR